MILALILKLHTDGFKIIYTVWQPAVHFVKHDQTQAHFIHLFP